MINKSIKIVVATLIICIFALGLVGLAEQKMETVTASIPLPQPRVVEKPTVAFLCTSMTSESAQRDYRHAIIEAEHRGWKMNALVDLSGAPAQRDALENVINQNVDVIIIVYFQMEPIADLIIKARQKGIGVYCIDTEYREGVIVNPTVANGVEGARLAYYGYDRLSGKGGVLFLNYTGHLLRQLSYSANGLIENDWPALEVLGFENMPVPGWQKASFDLTQNYITRFGEELTWVFAGWDTPGIFAARAVEEAGLTKDDIFITGIDGGPEAYAEIRKGSPFVATISQPFELYTHTTFEVINQVQVEGIGIGEESSIVPPSCTIYCDAVLTTADNLPEIGSSIHSVFIDTYYDPSKEDAWYMWGDPFLVQ